MLVELEMQIILDTRNSHKNSAPLKDETTELIFIYQRKALYLSFCSSVCLLTLFSLYHGFFYIAKNKLHKYLSIHRIIFRVIFWSEVKSSLTRSHIRSWLSEKYIGE